MDYENRVSLWIKYFYQKGIEDGAFIKEIPYRSLSIEQRRQVWIFAKKHAHLGLIPEQREDGVWVLRERK